MIQINGFEINADCWGEVSACIFPSQFVLNCRDYGIYISDGNNWIPQSIFPLIPNSKLAISGTADNTTFLRGDRTWASVGAGGPHASTHKHGGNDEVSTSAAGPNVIPKTRADGRLDMAFIASGTPDGTKFVRDDGTLVTPSGGGGSDPSLNTHLISSNKTITAGTCVYFVRYMEIAQNITFEIGLNSDLEIG